MKIFLSLALLGLTLSVFAKPDICTYEYSRKGSTLGWTAFKTPKKVGVSAKFSSFTIKAKKSASINDLLSSATFNVNSQAIDSGDKARDMKIAQFFFKKMLKGTKITGRVLSTSDTEAVVEITMNGTSKNVPMLKTFDEATSKITLKGAIDVLEFGMKDNLASLTKACFEKHEGVTWPNVEIQLDAMVAKSCK